MLKDRIINTIKFFDLQDFPLTLLEVHRFLVADVAALTPVLNENWELLEQSVEEIKTDKIVVDQILKSLETECTGQIENHSGFYCLARRKDIVTKRRDNYLYGMKRERLIKRYISFLRHIPFVRGVALSGSQAMGQQKPNSDIDLFIITDTSYLWLTRTLVTGYFQLIGKRRHGKFISNRFCLNHYVNSPKELRQFNNLYTATEYLKLRPLVYPEVIKRFQKYNSHWIQIFYPNSEFEEPSISRQSHLQIIWEFILSNPFGLWLEKRCKQWELPKIRKEKFIVVEEDELSFHPDSKQEMLLQKFFMRGE